MKNSERRRKAINIIQENSERKEKLADRAGDEVCDLHDQDVHEREFLLGRERTGEVDQDVADVLSKPSVEQSYIVWKRGRGKMRKKNLDPRKLSLRLT